MTKHIEWKRSTGGWIVKVFDPPESENLVVTLPDFPLDFDLREEACEAYNARAKELGLPPLPADEGWESPPKRVYHGCAEPPHPDYLPPNSTTNKFGYRGLSESPSGALQAHIVHKGEKVDLGVFRCQWQAARAVIEAEADPEEYLLNLKLKSDLFKSGWRGVYCHPHRPGWRVYINPGTGRVHLGDFLKLEDAKAAYRKAYLAQKAIWKEEQK